MCRKQLEKCEKELKKLENKKIIKNGKWLK